MITIDQLLESVDLDFEPRWVTKDNAGEIWVWDRKPRCSKYLEQWDSSNHCSWEELISKCLKLAEFDGKDWTECIYEVPRKTTGKIEKLKPTVRGFDEKPSMPTATDFLNKINELVAAVNELKEKNNG
jgi:hypothetical protein